MNVVKSILVIILAFAISCSAKQPIRPVYEGDLPITSKAEEITNAPEYLGKVSGESLALSEGETAPFDGVLLDEGLSFQAANLRVAYDEIYHLFVSDRKYMLSIIQIQEQELHKADMIIDKREKQIAELRDDWWANHKFQLGIIGGLILGCGLTFLAGYIWAEIENGE